ncbi:short chain dehydrogenase [Brachybacterium halotolerans subsp. kimchii]|uniref:short chain dehydrogenase n=1 Tax=Brachybacterium halotolerans TaxID=2795215 RepID=UPI001E564E27|nr:short chain dehydrogenase [Brachybacterium halotolerans]UEJ81987.1 short chain dehydrogenase [Brachybacterium halotolerans subsp. kimchii]
MTKRILVVGAGGLIGSEVASALEAAGHEVIRASRSSGERVDLTDPASIEALFERIGDVDAVVSTTGVVAFKPFAELTLGDFRDGVADKTLGQIALVTVGTAHVRDGGSFTLTSGVLSAESIETGAAASVANGALDSFAIAAAVGLPRGIRINTVSPSVIAEATGYHSSFPGFPQTPVAEAARAVVRSVDGVETGQIFSV